MLVPAPDKVCLKCGIEKPLACFPFRKAEQKHRNTCKACRAAESHDLRHHPDHAPIIRERERVRSNQRRPAIRQWERENPDNMRPGRQRRAARRAKKLVASRLAAAGSAEATASVSAATVPLQTDNTPRGVGVKILKPLPS